MTEYTPTIYAICGGVGAGKSTLARALVAKHRALLFTGDQWMSTLFFPDMVGTGDFDWVWERIGRCETQIWRQAEQAAEIGISSVLDLGLTTKDHRAKIAGFATESGLRFELHWLDISQEIRWERTQKRNEGASETYVFEVSRENFDFVEGMWEAPSDEEMRLMNGVHHTA